MGTDSLYKRISSNLIHWWTNNKTLYPWRCDISPHPIPYHVWLSEVMLQQTTTITVKSYFQKFIQKWPTLESLADSSLEDIFILWQGLGYYSRARNLHKAAQILKKEFPQKDADLQKIPGIGPYTAAAISSIAFNHFAVVIDGNVKRVVSRLFGEKDDKKIEAFAKILTPHDFPGDYAQSIMDFGRFICKPRNPLCPECPLQKDCYAFEHSAQTIYPIKKIKPAKQQQYSAAFVILDKSGKKIWIEEQNDRNLLKNLMSVPMTPWLCDQEWEDDDIILKAPLSLSWTPIQEHIKHEFTHITLRVKIFKGFTNKPLPQMVDIQNLELYPLSTLVKKIIRKAL